MWALAGASKSTMQATAMSELGQSPHFERATLTSGLPRERTSTDRPVWSGSCQKRKSPASTDFYNKTCPKQTLELNIQFNGTA